jgi:hypothetical protein
MAFWGETCRPAFVTLSRPSCCLGIQADYEGLTHLTGLSGCRTTNRIADHCNLSLSLQSAESRGKQLVIRSDSNPDEGRSVPGVAEEDTREGCIPECRTRELAWAGDSTLR